jgi:hypothetical protein
MTTVWVVLIVAALAFACVAVIGVRPPDADKLRAPEPARADAARAVTVDRHTQRTRRRPTQTRRTQVRGPGI